MLLSSMLPRRSVGRFNFDWGLHILLMLITKKVIYIHIYNTAVLINTCSFLINVAKLCEPLSKLDLQTLRKGGTKERTQRNK